MGTPDFSVPPLRALAEYDCEIPLVITMPDRPKGRGRKMVPPPVKTAALELGLEVIQPESMRSDEVRERLSALEPDLFVVVAFGHKLSQEILDIPKIYPINIHASLLPYHRGSSPIQTAILNLDKETGITTMVMDKDLDTGDMLLKSTTPIHDDDTAQDLHDRLADMGADLIIKTLDAIAEKRLTRTPQDHGKATLAPMLKKSDGKIDWAMTPEKISAVVRAMTPWPGAFTFLDEKRIKIFRVAPGETRSDAKPGTVFLCDDQGIHVAAGEGSVTILELQGASGKRLTAAEFLRGKPIEPGTVLNA
ncbi:MAG: methionyl-tRNA formyltransferase [Desulfobacteraceae bacterium]|nr:methionyl-tRNA formyltransferase [Desulfobacteraceae bacterium]